MNSVVDKYFSSRRNELCEYSSILINFYKYNKNDSLYKSKAEIISVIKKITALYFDKYYLSSYVNYKPVNKYYNFPPTIDDEFKSILLSGIKYLQSEELDIASNSFFLLYITTVIYIGELFYKFRYQIINSDNSTKFIFDITRKIGKSFAFITIDPDCKKELSELLKLVKECIKRENKTENALNNYHSDKSYNEFEVLNVDKKYYTVKYKYDIKVLEQYKIKDTKRIFNKENYDEEFLFISIEECLVTLLKSLIKNVNNYFVIRLNNKFLKKKSNINKLLKLLKSKYSKDHFKVLISYNKYNKTDNVLEIIQSGIEVLLDYDSNIVFDNEIKLEREVLVVSKEVLTKNKEYIDKNNIKYIVKDDKATFNEKTLLSSSESSKEE